MYSKPWSPELSLLLLLVSLLSFKAGEVKGHNIILPTVCSRYFDFPHNLENLSACICNYTWVFFLWRVFSVKIRTLIHNFDEVGQKLNEVSQLFDEVVYIIYSIDTRKINFG